MGETLDCEPPEITVSVELRQEAGVLSGVLTVGLNEAAVVGVQV